MELTPENSRAIELYWRLKRLGPEVVFSLQPLTVTNYQAAELLHSLELIAAHVEAHEKQEKVQQLKELAQSRGG